MKWGRKKSATFSIITKVLPLSWLFKLKLKRGSDSERKSRGEGGLYYPTPSKSLPGAGWKEGRFYSMSEDDAFWRISFSQERMHGRRSTGGMNMENPLWQVPDLEFEGEIGVARRVEGKGHQNFDEMVSDIRRMKDRQGKDKTGDKRNGQVKNQRQKDRCSKELSGGVPMERDVFPVEPESARAVQLEVYSRKKKSNVSNIRPSSFKEDFVLFEAPLGTVNNWKLKEIKLKPADDHFRKKPTCTSTESYSKRTRQHSNRLKAYSPRTECKIKALEEIKRSRMKWKKKPQVLGGETIFDSFAVVKNSSNPQQEFRDSMIEMIRVKGITRGEDLEELLACYLTLNCEEYHDLIIKVFQQVWSDL